MAHARRAAVIILVFIAYVLVLGARAVAQPLSSGDEAAVESSGRRLSETTGLTHAQTTLMEALAVKKKKEESGPAIKKRGYMNLVTELSRIELAKQARNKALANLAAAAASPE